MAKREVRCGACSTLNRMSDYSIRHVPNCGKCGADLPEPAATKALRKVYVLRFPITLIAFFGVFAWALWLTAESGTSAVPRPPPKALPQRIACVPVEPYTIGEAIYRVYETQDRPRLTKWTISAGAGANYFVKLFDLTTGLPKVSYFVAGGSAPTTDVPVGTYVVKYASGRTWCGERDLFGAETATKKGKRMAEIDEDHTYTLYLSAQPHGNFPTESIPRSEF
jgi:hypothetical protein